MPRIRLGDNDLPLPEDLETLSIAEWMAWIQARQSEYDPFTGQALRGAANALAMIRDAVVRQQGALTAARFAEASSQILRDELVLFLTWKLEERSDQDECVRRAFVFSEFLDVLATIPVEILQTSRTFHTRFTDCHRLLEQRAWTEDRVGWDKHAYLYLIAACMRFLYAHSDAFSRNQAEFWLQHVDTAEVAMAILMREYPKERVRWCTNCLRSFLKAKHENLIPSLLRRLGRSMSAPDYDALLRQIMRQLSVKQRTAIRREFARR